MELPQLVHETLIRETQKDRLIGHIARDSTSIEARERFPETDPPKEAKAVPSGGAKRGPKKGSRGPHKRWKGGKPLPTPKADTRLHRQRTMGLQEMLKELSLDCSIGVKTSSKGHQQYWRGYKLHLDVADGQIPISAVLTGAKVHDSQVAIPLATLSAQRVTYCYELMDAAYDAQEIREHSQAMGHVAIVDPSGRGRKSQSVTIPLGKPQRQLTWAEKERYKERTMIERVNGRLKDEFGGRSVRVRGAAKVMAHLMFGVLVLTVDQIQRLLH
jgi:Transposase DDE domain